MLLNEEELKRYVQADQVGEHFVCLTPAAIYEFTGRPTLGEMKAEAGTKVPVEQYNDAWQLNQGAYFVDCEEIIHIPSGGIGVINGSPLLHEVGGDVGSQIYTGKGRPSVLLNCFTSIDIEDGATIADLYILDPKKVSEEVEELLREDVEQLVETKPEDLPDSEGTNL